MAATDPGIDVVNVHDLAAAQLERAASSPEGRAAAGLLGAHVGGLGQTVVALTAGSTIPEHDNPGTATLMCVHGRAQLVSGSRTVDLAAGDWVVIADERHMVLAVEDCAVLLTVVPHH